MTIERLRDVLSAAGLTANSLELAEIFWLARHLTAGQSPVDGAGSDEVGSGQQRGHAGGRGAVFQQPSAPGPVRSGQHAAKRTARGLYAETAPDGRTFDAGDIQVPTAPMLHDALAVQRALRPLKRRVASHRAETLDEELTAARIADHPPGRQRWVPVLRPAPERWLSLALVVDTGPSMRIWHPLVRELEEALIRLGAFRNLHRWYLHEGAIATGPAGPWLGAAALIDPSRRQAALVLSDCSGTHWWNGSASRALCLWAQNGPAAILQPLSERLWRRTATPPLPGYVRARRAAAPNAELLFTPHDVSRREGLPVPVMEISPRWLADWAHLIAGPPASPLAMAAAYVSGATVTRGQAVQRERDLPIAERVQRFRATASPEAAWLAAHVAVSVPTLPVIRLIHQRLTPSPQPGHIAEVLLSGLLRPAGGAADVYEFIPGARQALLATLPRSASWYAADVLSRLSAEIENRIGREGELFRAYLQVPTGTGNRALPVTQPFALVSAEALHYLRRDVTSLPPVEKTVSRRVSTRRQAATAGTGGPAAHARTYALLGKLEIGSGGRLLELPGVSSRSLLAALLLNANRPVSKGDLIRAAWGSDDVSDMQLYKQVKMLRDLLDQIGRGGDLVTRRGFGYEIRVDESDVDALLFQRLVRKASEAGAERRTADEIDLFRQAIRLWRGPEPLSNVPGAAFRQEIFVLRQRHKRAAGRLFELELADGNHDRVLDELILAAAFHPSDRRLCELLMLALYRCGHLTEVASAYERYREALAQETSGMPDALLRTFHFAVARGDQAAMAEAESAMVARSGMPAATPTPARRAPRQLPRPDDLIGRDSELAEISWLLGRAEGTSAPVVVICGPGGIGKTALAMRAAHNSSSRYPDGQLYADLRASAVGGAIDHVEVLAMFLRSLGASSVPETTAERLAEYRTALADRRVLIVLDDAADGTQVRDLVPASPGCAVLITARQRLPDLSNAYHLPPLGSLDQSEAAELFLRTVRDGGIVPDHDLATVDRVVALCGGLPLALRIAGALRVHDHPRPTAELADRLSQRGPEALAYGDLSVAGVIGAGFERLGADAQRLFLSLGLLSLISFGQWTAAALLDGSDGDPVTALGQLAAKFMIESTQDPSSYRFHDLMREYARRRALADYSGGDQIPSMAYRALLTLTRRAHAGLYGGEFEVVHSEIPDWAGPPEALAEVDASPLGWFGRERSNIRAVVEHCAALGLTSLCWDLAVSAHEFYTIGGYFDDWFVTHTVALSACRQAGDRRGEGIVLACLNQPALLASRRAGSAPILADLRRAVNLLADCGDAHGEAIALRTYASALGRQGYLTEALALLGDALARYVASEDPVGRWMTLRFIGQTHLDLGHLEEARRFLEEAETVAGELGSAILSAQTQYWIGQVCLGADDLNGARDAFDAVFDVSDDASIGHGYALHGMGEVARHRGTYEVAEHHFAQAAMIARDGADAVLEGRICLSIAELRQAQGRSDEQVAMLEDAMTAFTGCGVVSLEARTLAALAQAMTDRGDVAAADAAWTRLESLYDAAAIPDQDRIHRPADI